MRCPYCHATDDKVVDSRSADGGAAIRRRRQCLACGRRFTTYERVEEVALVVRKRSGVVEPFDRAKVVDGIRKAAAGRPAVADAEVEALVSSVDEQLRAAGPEVTSEEVGLAVLDRLRDLDDVAYLRFASVYKGFEGLADFEREAQMLQERRVLEKKTEPKPHPSLPA